jgi:N-acetyl-alpha-D-muramate 1-phosphate uridylyltransferase
MRAMILAAGLGSRLKKLTENTPKCLMEAGNITILEHVVNKLKHLSINNICINTHYLSEKIEEYLKQKNNFEISITLFKEDKLLGTGGGVRNASLFLEKSADFIIYNSDIYSEFDLDKLIAAHRSSKAMVTLAVKKRDTSRVLLFDENNYLAGWENLDKETGERFGKSDRLTPYGFLGIHIVNSEFLKLIGSFVDPFSITDAYITASKEGVKIKAYDIGEDFWIDIGTPEKLEELQLLLASPKGEFSNRYI